jgi:hypothetical protein
MISLGILIWTIALPIRVPATIILQGMFAGFIIKNVADYIDYSKIIKSESPLDEHTERWLNSAKLLIIITIISSLVKHLTFFAAYAPPWSGNVGIIVGYVMLSIGRTIYLALT